MPRTDTVRQLESEGIQQLEQNTATSLKQMYEQLEQLKTSAKQLEQMPIDSTESMARAIGPIVKAMVKVSIDVADRAAETTQSITKMQKAVKATAEQAEQRISKIEETSSAAMNRITAAADALREKAETEQDDWRLTVIAVSALSTLGALLWLMYRLKIAGIALW